MFLKAFNKKKNSCGITWRKSSSSAISNISESNSKLNKFCRKLQISSSVNNEVKRLSSQLKILSKTMPL